MKTVVIKIPHHIVPAQSPHFAAACELRAWCREHIQNGWSSYFLATTIYNHQERSTGFIAFDFKDPKEAMKFSLWAGNA